ncbi:MAG: FMN-dependent NADH-azoreductase [Telluria sp.]
MTIRILHVDSSILGSQSVSRELSAAVVARYKTKHEHVEVTYRDLAVSPLPHLDGREFLAMRMQQVPDDADALAQIAPGNAVLEEFLAADVIVLGVAFYNFGIASQLKAWVDRIAVPGKTFRYTQNGVEGLAGGKRVIMTVARGGFYGPGSPVASFEHAASYLRSVFTFAGITDIDVISADGLAVNDQRRAAAIGLARQDIDKLSMA